MELKGVSLNLIKKRLENLNDKNGEERVKELQIILRVIYPLVADSKGGEVLELFTKLKRGEGTEEAEKFIRETINSL